MSCATRPLPSSTPTYIRCPPSGQCWQIQESNGRTSIYGYDSLYRLKSEAISADPLGHNGITTYTYDAVGNRQTRTSTLGLLSAQSLTYNARDWADGDTYDANGNTLVGGATAPATTGTDTYDFEDRLLRRTLPDGTSIALKYDGDGLRHSKTVTPLGGPSQTTYFVVDTLNPTGYAQVLEELVEDPLFPSSLTVTKAYTYGHDLVACEQLTDGLRQTHYYGYDGHGSTRQLFDANGHLTDTYTYDAFGTLLSRTGTTDNHYLYCGEQWDDDLGLYYLRARYMNPWAGRFWSMDSFEGYLNDPQSLHKYIYAHANPVMWVDPSGYEPLVSQGMAVSTVGTLSTTTIQSIARKVGQKVGCELFEIAVEEAIGSGIYIFIESAGAYVGKSIDVERRIKQHTDKAIKQIVAKVKFIGLKEEHLRKVEQLILDAVRKELGLEGVTDKKNPGAGIANKIEPTNKDIRSKLRKAVNLEFCK